MCLSVYLGTSNPLKTSSHTAFRSLGYESASWTPPSLAGYGHVYYIGQNYGKDQLGCSCMLMEYVKPDDGAWNLQSDELYDDTKECPFATLRDLCENALKSSVMCGLVCDDSGGLEQDCDVTDYCMLYLSPNLIKRGNMLFSHRYNDPWRHYDVFRSNLTR